MHHHFPWGIAQYCSLSQDSLFSILQDFYKFVNKKEWMYNIKLMKSISNIYFCKILSFAKKFLHFESVGSTLMFGRLKSFRERLFKFWICFPELSSFVSISLFFCLLKDKLNLFCIDLISLSIKWFR